MGLGMGLNYLRMRCKIIKYWDKFPSCCLLTLTCYRSWTICMSSLLANIADSVVASRDFAPPLASNEKWYTSLCYVCKIDNMVTLINLSLLFVFTSSRHTY